MEDSGQKQARRLFRSFQDYLGRNPRPTQWHQYKKTNGCTLPTGIASSSTNTTHGAWREKAKDLFEAEDDEERRATKGEAIDHFSEDILLITVDHYLYLSGTPFHTIVTSEFIEEQVYNWTYPDEQRAKAEWNETKGAKPYTALPRMVLMTYQLPGEIRQIALQGKMFFSAEGVGEHARFKHEAEVQKWLDLICGAYLPASIDELNLGRDRRPPPAVPAVFRCAPPLGVLSHPAVSAQCRRLLRHAQLAQAMAKQVLSRL